MLQGRAGKDAMVRATAGGWFERWCTEAWLAWNRPRSPRRCLTVAGLLFGFAIWAWFDVRSRARIEPDRPWEHQTDLTVYTEAGAAFFDGRPPYEVSNLRGWRYLYPPFFAMLVAPLAWFDPQVQALDWFALSLAMGWGCVCELRRIAQQVTQVSKAGSISARSRLWSAGPRQPDAEPASRSRTIERAMLCFGCLAVLAGLVPMLNCLQRGQLGIAITYLLCLGFRLISGSRSWRGGLLGGVVLAGAAVLKVTPLLPAAMVVWQCGVQAWRQRAGRGSIGRAAGAGLGLGGGLVLFLFLLPGALVGWRTNLGHLDTWCHRVLMKASDAGHDDFAGNPHSWRNQSLSNGVYRLGIWAHFAFAGGPDDRLLDQHGYVPTATPMDHPCVAQGLNLIRIALLVLLAAAGIATGLRGDRLGQAAGFGLACAATLVLSPVARAHYFMLLLPATWFVPARLYLDGRWRTAWCMAAAPALLVVPHYLLLDPLGRLGYLGIGTAAWCVAGTALLARPWKGREAGQAAQLAAQVPRVGHRGFALANLGPIAKNPRRAG